MTLEGLIRQAYPSPEWAVFSEVGNTTGFGTRRHADAVALGIWQSRGFTLVGFEFKEYRSDWLREKKNPEKAEAVSAHCDCWYVVAGSADVVKVDELPEPWGLYVANEDRTKLKTVKPCVPFPDRDKTIMRRSFAAAMLRKVGETTIPKVELQRLIDEGLAAAVARTHDGHELKMLREQVQRKQAIIDGFEARTGVDLEHWRGHEKIAAAVDVVLRSEDSRSSLEHVQRQLETIARDTKKALAQWPALSTEEPPPRFVAVVPADGIVAEPLRAQKECSDV